MDILALLVLWLTVEVSYWRLVLALVLGIAGGRSADWSISLTILLRSWPLAIHLLRALVCVGCRARVPRWALLVGIHSLRFLKNENGNCVVVVAQLECCQKVPRSRSLAHG